MPCLGRQLGVRQFDDAFRFMSVWGYFTGAKYLDINGVAHAHSEVQETPPVTYVTSLDGIGNAGWCVVHCAARKHQCRHCLSE